MDKDNDKDEKRMIEKVSEAEIEERDCVEVRKESLMDPTLVFINNLQEDCDEDTEKDEEQEAP